MSILGEILILLMEFKMIYDYPVSGFLYFSKIPIQRDEMMIVHKQKWSANRQLLQNTDLLRSEKLFLREG